MEDDKAAQSNYMGQEKDALCPGIAHRVEQATKAQRGMRCVTVLFL
jgi:hypothetical protein